LLKAALPFPASEAYCATWSSEENFQTSGTHVQKNCHKGNPNKKLVFWTSFLNTGFQMTLTISMQDWLFDSK
jgi:hypothetical protein